MELRGFMLANYAEANRGTTLTSQFIEPLCYRADGTVWRPILPLIFGELAKTGFSG